MKIAFISDLHGHMPFIYSCDVAVFPGDFLSLDTVEEEERVWQEKYSVYFNEIRKRGIFTVGMPGNHDFIKISLIKKNFDVFCRYGIRDIHGFKFFFYCYNNIKGHNYCKSYGEHVSMLNLPDGFKCDFFISHVPPYDILSEKPELGLKPIRDCVERIKPKHAHVFGHCHMDRGVANIGKVTYCNASYCLNPQNEPRYEYMVYDTELKTFSIQSTYDMSL